MRETELTSRMIAEVKRLGGWAIKSTGVSEAGTPDILGCLRGRTLAIEVKLPGQRPRPLQVKRLEQWAAAGAIAFWADSLEKVKKVLASV